MIGGARGTDYSARMDGGRRMAVPGAQCVCVHGPAGDLDLVVPTGATGREVAEEYARQTSLSSIPVLLTTLGRAVRPDLTLADSGLSSGDVLVAVSTVLPSAPAIRHRGSAASGAVSGPAVSTWLGAAAVLAVLGGVLAAWLPTGGSRTTAVAALALAALVGALPLTGAARQRALAAPAFAGAAVLALVWQPGAAALPLVVGIAALAAAATAALARALAREPHEGLLVWVVGGIATFVLTGTAALLGMGPAVVWSLALVAAMVAARVIPAVAVDVPDQMLVDLERLAVTAWSARERPRGRRGRAVVPSAFVAAVADRGGRIVTAGAVAVAGATGVAATQLLATADRPVDRVGARLLVGLVGAALVLVARTHRHGAARSWLRVGGLTAWLSLAWHVRDGLSAEATWGLVGGAVALAVGLVVAAVATGRGWRSAWWSRRAELAEALAGALAVAAVTVSTGLFRHLWEFASTRFSG